MDQGLAQVDGVDFLGTLAGPGRNPPSREHRDFVAKAEPMAKRALRALFAAGLYRELPSEAHADPRIVASKASMSPELDHSVAELTTMLESMPQHELTAMRGVLERDPELVMRVSQAIGEKGRALEVPYGSRAKARAAATNLAFRLRKQPPELVIEECIDKVHRVAARHGLSLVVAQQVAAETMRQDLWGNARNAQEAPPTPPRPPVVEPPGATPVGASPDLPPIPPPPGLPPIPAAPGASQYAPPGALGAVPPPPAAPSPCELPPSDRLLAPPEAGARARDRVRSWVAAREATGQYDADLRAAADAPRALQAAAALGRAVASRPNDPARWAALGWARYSNGATLMAREAFQTALHWDPQCSLALDGENQLGQDQLAQSALPRPAEGPVPGVGAQNAGAYLLASGLGVGLASFGLIATESDAGLAIGLVGLTVASLLVIIGLIALLIGTIVRAAS
jgi:hypothetical protein